jgi:opacity protein-like surface antigen
LLGADNDLSPFTDGGGGGGDGGDGAAVDPGIGGIGGAGGDAFLVDADTTYSDALVGLHVGYNWQRDNRVYGIEADIDANETLDTLLGSVRVRLGHATDRTLFYVTAGLAYVDVGDSISNVFVGGDGGDGGAGGAAGITANGVVSDPGTGVVTLTREGASAIGFVGGAGVEYRLTNQIGLGIEGLYYTFGDDYLGIAEDGDFFTVRARLTMHLNRDQEMDSLKDSQPVLAHWGGWYMGAHAGAAFDASDDSIDSVDANAGGDGGDGTDGIGNGGGGGGGGGAGGSAVARLDQDLSFVGGVNLGYNIQRGSMVYGLESDISFENEEKYSYLSSVRARLGYASGAYLFYATAGVAFARLESHGGIFAGDGADGTDGGDALDGAGGVGGAGGVAGTLGGDPEDVVGYVVGVGVDARLSDRVSLGFEGLYYNFDGDGDGGAIPAGAAASFTDDDDDSVFVLRGRLSYHLSTTPEPLK